MAMFDKQKKEPEKDEDLDDAEPGTDQRRLWPGGTNKNRT
jgi:hypothetical protein